LSAVILPNGSLIFRLPDQTIHLDVEAREIQVRDGLARGELEGQLLLRFPLSAASMVRLLPESAEHAHLYLEFDTGEVLDLGRLPVGIMGRQIASTLAKSARCRMTTVLETPARTKQPDFAEVSHEPRTVSEPIQPLPIVYEKTEEADLPSAPLPTIAADLVEVEDEAPTHPPRDPAEKSNDFDATVRIDIANAPPPKLSSTEAA
jgi:hypothetical protein